jgi:glycyl-tRNA synthetase beta chain
LDHLKRFIAESGEFQSLALTFKRVSNIIKDQERSLDVDQSMFKEDCESDLWKAYQGLKDKIYMLKKDRKYLEALNLAVELRKPIDRFFDGVEIMTRESKALKKNRVAILHLADFSKFSI